MASTPATTVNVRYMVDDVDAAVAWYTTHLGFTLLSNAAPAFADVTLGSLRRCSAGRQAPPGERCPMASAPVLEAGTAFT
jgi:catechol 2,3-dioxygenase-like lactoylglutathione lyase family enzyme